MSSSTSQFYISQGLDTLDKRGIPPEELGMRYRSALLNAIALRLVGDPGGHCASCASALHGVHACCCMPPGS